MTEEGNYWSRVFREALAETVRFWNAHRIAITLATPLLGFLWIAYTSGLPFGSYTLVQTAVSSVVIFAGGWALAFLVSLLRAPAILDARWQTRVEELSSAVRLPDNALAARLSSKLQGLETHMKEVLKAVLSYDEPIPVQHIKAGDLTSRDIHDALVACSKEGLVQSRTEEGVLMGHITTRQTFYWIPEGYKKPLKLLLHAKAG